MIRRSFRIGLTLGLLGGLAFALTKVLGARSGPPAAPAPTPAPRPMRAEAVERVPAAAPAPAVKAPELKDPSVKAPAEKSVAKKAPPTQAAAKKPAAKKKAPAAVWVTPKGDVCPTSHPVKAKLTSKIFHLPGMLNYDRTKPDRCYRDANSATDDGLRAAKR